MNEPDKSIYNSKNLENYEDIMVKTKAMCAINKKDGARILNKPAASINYKYNEIIKPMWHRNKPKATRKTTRKLVAAPIILPSDPNELINMLELRMDAYHAGHTGVVNEIVAICDELLRRGEIDKETYKEYVTKLNRLK